jgi:putative phosphoribosyl transferase
MTATTDVLIPAGEADLPGLLTIPDGARAVVAFAHGSGSSRHSPRNQLVATLLQRAGFATLLFDLLRPDEERDRANVFAIALLGERLAAATQWLTSAPPTGEHRVGYFGASTGAAAALWAAADGDLDVGAVVSRGGRPDLAGDRLPLGRAPTLLIVGGEDHVVLDLNRAAARRMSCPHELTVVPGASHLFEEPGTLEAAAALARAWFTRYLLEVG